MPTTNAIKLQAATQAARTAPNNRSQRRESQTDREQPPFEQVLQKRADESKQPATKDESKYAQRTPDTKPRAKTGKKSKPAREQIDDVSPAAQTEAAQEVQRPEDQVESSDAADAVEEVDEKEQVPPETHVGDASTIETVAVPLDIGCDAPTQQVGPAKQPVQKDVTAVKSAAKTPVSLVAAEDKSPQPKEAKTVNQPVQPVQQNPSSELVEQQEADADASEESPDPAQQQSVQPQVKRDVQTDGPQVKSKHVDPLRQAQVQSDADAEDQQDAHSSGSRPNDTRESAKHPIEDVLESLSVARDSDSSAASAATDERMTVSLAQSHAAAIPQVSAPDAHHPTVAPAPPSTPGPAPETQFALDNHPHIVNSVRANLLPSGGTMQIRLDPPQLGAMQLTVRMHDGVMSAAFETSSDQATHLLSHSLGELRSALEASGIAVDKLHVEQSPKNHQSQQDNADSRQQQGNAQDSPARRDQQRRELLERMWRRLSEGSDPLDMVA